jgi:beta-1,4-mannosyl-glycoprotein beta-1,4-N-acetylglucosaminyltransferase
MMTSAAHDRRFPLSPLPMIYDCFIFFQELDVLEIRFRELAPVVDRFVLVEAPVTFSGRPKPLFYHENAARFGAYRDKIIHVVVDDMPGGDDAWGREAYQRDAVERGLRECRQDDIVMISDADEIPSASAVREYRLSLGMMKFRQWLSYYWLNCRGPVCFDSRILPFGLYRQFGSASNVRKHDCAAIDGGWHFSYVGGPDMIRRKLESFSHTELDLPAYKNSAHLENALATGRDLFGRDQTFQFVDVDETFPRCILDDRDRFRHLIYEGD